MNMEVNVFEVENLSKLSATYRLWRLRGLVRWDADSEMKERRKLQQDYYRNLHSLVGRVSRELRSPVTFVEEQDVPFLVIREDGTQPKSEYSAIGCKVYLERGHQELKLDFAHLDNKTVPIALRFLQFSLQGVLKKNHDLWQPGTGHPFFEKRGLSVAPGILLHRGMSVRAVELESGRIGLCVDMRHRYISASPLPSKMDRRAFQQHKMRHVIYRMGHYWSEVRLAERSALSVTQMKFKDNGEEVNLLEYLHKCSDKPLPPELVVLPKDCAVVHYYNSRKEQRAAPSVLCYRVVDPANVRTRGQSGRTQLPPGVRRSRIAGAVTKYLSNVGFGGTALRLARHSHRIRAGHFPIPDLRFGNGKVLSVKGTSGAIHTTVEKWGQKRMDLLLDKSVGFYVNDPFQKQFFFMPETIHQSWGPQFMKDLCNSVYEFYPQDPAYDPELVPYDDRQGGGWVAQGLAIKAAAAERGVRTGFGVVMIHEPTDRKPRKEDPLAAYALQMLFDEFDIRAAVMHTEVGTECYRIQTANGEMAYAAAPAMRGKLSGYVRAVALNKVLLTNEKWPFVLAEPTYADLVIGVDVKRHHVGLTVVGLGGEYIRTYPGKCRFAEQIQADEFERLFIHSVRRYCEETGQLAKTICGHRDGRMDEPEQQGGNSGMEYLLGEGFVAPGASLTFVVIPKRKRSPLRGD